MGSDDSVTNVGDDGGMYGNNSRRRFGNNDEQNCNAISDDKNWEVIMVRLVWVGRGGRGGYDTSCGGEHDDVVVPLSLLSPLCFVLEGGGGGNSPPSFLP